jgi:hypothetical protein
VADIPQHTTTHTEAASDLAMTGRIKVLKNSSHWFGFQANDMLCLSPIMVKIIVKTVSNC